MKGTEEHYYHMFANGDDAKDFVISEQDFISAFNRFGVCAHLTGARVVAHSVEDSHAHALLWGDYDTCEKFKKKYQDMSVRHIVQTRGSARNVHIDYELDEITDESYLMNVGTYVIVQATKDGKAVLPEHYRYCTAALYFRGRYSSLPWLIDDDGNQKRPVTFGSLTYDQKRRICGTRDVSIPDEWLICEGFILPDNYVDIKRFESIYRTHNCYRVFCSSSRKQDEVVRFRMSNVRGVMIEDLEARRICRGECGVLFGRDSTRTLTAEQRLELAQKLRTKYHLSYRQLSMLVYVPEAEIRKYVR